MRRKIGVAGTLLAATFWLAGCALWQSVGPCYGVGCRAGLMAPHAATQQSAQAKPANTKKSKSFASSLMIWRHSKPTADSAPSNPPSTPATSPTAASQSGGK
ncbi:MAG: hypothetical protein WAN23_13115 [Candidatus Acidiferrales bacterium]